MNYGLKHIQLVAHAKSMLADWWSAHFSANQMSVVRILHELAFVKCALILTGFLNDVALNLCVSV